MKGETVECPASDDYDASGGKLVIPTEMMNEPRCEKTGLRGFRPGLTQTWLYSHRKWLEARNFGFRSVGWLIDS